MQGGLTSTFTPGNGVHSGISISCDVFEGTSYSYSDGNYDSKVTKTWGGSLTTFKVGVQMDPDAVKYYEDDVNSSKQFDLLTSTDLEGLGCYANSGPDEECGPTGTFNDSGDCTDPAMTWTVFAETDNGSVGGIMGSISHSPNITVGGYYYVQAGFDGIPDVGFVGTMASEIAGLANPYLKAAVKCIVATPGSRTHYKYSFLSKSVIENIGNPDVPYESLGTSYAYVPFSIGGLSTSGGVTRNLIAPTTHGSLAFDSLVQVVDDSSLNFAYAEIVSGLSQYFEASFGSTCPTYSGYY